MKKTFTIVHMNPGKSGVKLVVSIARGCLDLSDALKTIAEEAEKNSETFSPIYATEGAHANILPREILEVKEFQSTRKILPTDLVKG